MTTDLEGVFMQPTTITFCGKSGEEIVKIGPGYKVEVNPKYSADEAARAFWDAVIRCCPTLTKAENMTLGN